MRVVDLDRETVKRGLDDGSMLIIDVREPHEYAAGHIPGAVSHPLSSFDPRAVAALVAEDGRRAVFSCAAGVRSVHALMAAQNAGLDLAEHYKGGFKDWYSAGETVD
ncbi:rhodanese-related sulfurtransferase [Methylobacterium sp. PvP062]|jgi:rhodanese-related sulfurtransferase|uniref:Rhodanese domain protein n=2 Tax=Methylobacterium radiotolerans TaxID=31998 RepID=B1LZ09_METRJ|nr:MULTISPECIES: rhodanese-like domain-containing protein [Methylobacterium]MCX7335810.1 rhodanese-like domain-containing protein [Hyphomicrobiales bacterium]GAN50336.1 rhodanese domain-containing protein [Methylobacterium sp. ME121]ACB24430.1 Rhodanese domain protein [Methylobacterium radiotolerans JCM 2831]KIU33684.1 sulfurtransferase [Methylobacterium radiotolerans]KTS12207.1 sulfurtransferase [Methylobacterium radiotolerans]